jgi:hypothetical protein
MGCINKYSYFEYNILTITRLSTLPNITVILGVSIDERVCQGSSLGEDNKYIS